VKPPKKMLIELPTADEIDDLAVSTPKLSVRKFEYDRRGVAADLDYTPCKGQIMLVVRGEKGTVLVKRKGEKGWALPSGTINTYEDIATAAKRVAKDTCGLSVKSMDLAAMYDVIWHFEGVTIKRLHIVYAAITDDECSKGTKGDLVEAAFHKDVPMSILHDELDRTALDDCGEK